LLGVAKAVVSFLEKKRSNALSSLFVTLELRAFVPCWVMDPRFSPFAGLMGDRVRFLFKFEAYLGTSFLGVYRTTEFSRADPLFVLDLVRIADLRGS